MFKLHGVPYLKDEMNPKRVSGSYTTIGIHSIRIQGPYF